MIFAATEKGGKMMAELKPCPFCGGEDLMMVDDDDYFFVGCNTCDTCGPGEGTEEEAIEAWNKRADNG